MILWCSISVVFSCFKRLHYSKNDDATFWNDQIVLATLLFAFTHLVSIPTLLMIILNVSLHKCLVKVIPTILSQYGYWGIWWRYHDIWFCPYRPALLVICVFDCTSNMRHLHVLSFNTTGSIWVKVHTWHRKLCILYRKPSQKTFMRASDIQCTSCLYYYDICIITS